MADWVTLFLAASATALATGLGAIPAFLFESRREQLRPFLFGVTAGMMGVASVVGLLLPAIDEGSTGSVVAGLVVGVVFMAVTRRLVGDPSEQAGVLVSSKAARDGRRLSMLVFIVLLVHSLPEGLAIGTAFASDREGLSLFVILAIGLQNVPEGTSVAIPMQAAGYSRKQQFWAAVMTSAPQPVGALIAFALVDQVESLLPFSFAFAAGAMLALVFVELIPEALREREWSGALAGIAAGGAVMLALSAVLGV